MIASVLIPLAVLGVVVGAVILFVRSRDTLDLSPRGVLRGYLYVASLAGVLTFAIGVAAFGNWALASSFGTGLIYGEQGRLPVPACPPNEPRCGPTAEQVDQQLRFDQERRERQRSEDLLRGITYMAFGGAFWAAHWAARRSLADDRAAGVRRGYLMLGTMIFGLATIFFVPTGLYQVLSYALLPAANSTFRQGADAVGGAIAVVPIWLLYLRLVVADMRATPPAAA